MSNTTRKIRVAILANGAYKQLVEVFEEQEVFELFTPVVYGSLKSLKHACEELQVKIPINSVGNASQMNEGVCNVVDVAPEQEKERVVKEQCDGLTDVIIAFSADENYLDSIASLYEAEISAEVIRGEQLSVVSIAERNDNTDYVTQEQIMTKVEAVFSYLSRYVLVDNPRVAVLSLNETITVDENSVEMMSIAPVISHFVNKGHQAFGPYSRQGFFENGLHLSFDAVVAMNYADAIKPFLSHYNSNPVKISLGVPVVLVSTLNDEANGLYADRDAALKAIYTALDVFRTSKRYDRAHRSPLPKLYHERREDGDKARFAVKKSFREEPAAPKESGKESKG